MEIKVPEVGESVFEALVAKWHIRDGERVVRDEPVCEIETDKITMELNAEAEGVLRIRIAEGTTVKIGTVIGEIEEAGTGDQGPGIGSTPGTPAGSDAERSKSSGVPAAEAGRHVSPSERKSAREKAGTREAEKAESRDSGLGTRKEEQQAKAVTVPVTLVRSEEPAPYAAPPLPDERVVRKPMTPIRKRIAERLLAARQQTAMLTSFNEADLGRVMALRRKYGPDFLKRHGVKLGYMSFFVKACCEALREFPVLNARMDGDDIVYQNFFDIGIAVSGDKGLVVPVLRDADRLHFAEIEQAIDDFVKRIGENRLGLADLEGGTFTITNGGVFGSLMSTPILNPPQSGVLGMHAIQERPVARDGKVVIRPMMYLALSYDHRIIDGREAVLFLKKVREYLEEPEELLLEG